MTRQTYWERIRKAKEVRPYQTVEELRRDYKRIRQHLKSTKKKYFKEKARRIKKGEQTMNEKERLAALQFRDWLASERAFEGYRVEFVVGDMGVEYVPV